MIFLKHFITSILFILIICTGLALFGRYLLLNLKKEIKTKYIIIKICDFTIKVFIAWHIPLLLLQSLFSIIDMFTLLNGTSQLITTVIIAIISIIIERLIENTKFSEFFKGSFNSEPDNTAVFAYIDLYREIEKNNLGIIQQLSASQTNLLSQFETTNKEANLIMENISNYAQIQNSECHKLLEVKNEIDYFFNELSENTKKFCDLFTRYEKKLDNSHKALIYYEESESLIDEVNISFASKFKQSSNNYMGRFDVIEHQIRRVIDEFSKFNELITHNIERVKSYHWNMENIFQSLENEIDSKQTIILIRSKELAGMVKETNNNINDTLKNLNSYLNRNTFVLSKIFNTYKVNPLTPRELKKVIKNWPFITGKR